MAIYQLDNLVPQVADSAWVADSAQVMGDVLIGEHSSVWFGAIARGDTQTIRLGSHSNVQDGCVLHADLGFPLTLGDFVTVGHQAVLHGCTVGEGALIGIGAVVLNGAQIGRNSLVAARALVPQGRAFADASLIMGSPAQVVRALTEQEIEDLRRIARQYVLNAQRFRTGITRLR